MLTLDTVGQRTESDLVDLDDLAAEGVHADLVLRTWWRGPSWIGWDGGGRDGIGVVPVLNPTIAFGSGAAMPSGGAGCGSRTW